MHERTCEIAYLVERVKLTHQNSQACFFNCKDRFFCQMSRPIAIYKSKAKRRTVRTWKERE